MISLYKTILTYLIIELLCSTTASATGTVPIPNGAEEWRPITITTTEYWFWNKQYSSYESGPWYSIIKIIEDTLKEHPITEQFEEERTLPVTVKQSKTGELEVLNIEGDFLPQITKSKFGRALHDNLNRFWSPEEQEKRELLTDSFTINIPLPSNATRQYAIETMKNMLFDRCLDALEKTGIPDTANLTRIPMGKSSSTFTSAIWASKRFPMEIVVHDVNQKDQTYRSCAFDNPYDNMPTYINENDFIQLVNQWAEKVLDVGNYHTPHTCQNTEINKFYSSTSPTVSRQHIKVTSSVHDPFGGQFLRVTASQNDTKLCP